MKIMTFNTQHCLNYLENKIDFEMGEDDFIDEIIKKEELKKYGARYIKRELKKKILERLKDKKEVCNFN